MVCLTLSWYIVLRRMLSYQPFAIKDEFITADDVLSFEVSPTTITTGNLIVVVIVFITIMGL